MWLFFSFPVLAAAGAGLAGRGGGRRCQPAGGEGPPWSLLTTIIISSSPASLSLSFLSSSSFSLLFPGSLLSSLVFAVHHVTAHRLCSVYNTHTRRTCVVLWNIGCAPPLCLTRCSCLVCCMRIACSFIIC